jgi:hypothetical protein
MKALSVLAILCLGQLLAGCSDSVTANQDPVADVTQEDLESLQSQAPEDYREQLGAVIDRHPDEYLRERAVFALVDIARQKGEISEIVETLKDIAYNEPQDDVRSAAYANLDLIDTLQPQPSRATLELTVEGEIRKAATVTVVARVSSEIDIPQARLTIDCPVYGIEPANQPLYKLSLVGGEPQEIRFDIQLNETGRNMVQVVLFLSYDRTESESVEKIVFFNISETSGDSEQYSF